MIIDRYMPSWYQPVAFSLQESGLLASGPRGKMIKLWNSTVSQVLIDINDIDKQIRSDNFHFDSTLFVATVGTTPRAWIVEFEEELLLQL